MMIRLTLATGLVMVALAPRPAAAADNAQKKYEKEALRLSAKCAKEAAKDERDAERERTHPRQDNVWDELCAPPLPPPVMDPPAVEPPADMDPVLLPPPLLPPFLPPF